MNFDPSIREMTNVAADGRISPGCAGMYAPEHQEAWKRVVDFVHERTPARIALQLGHAGPKGSTRVIWEGEDEPLEEGGCLVRGRLEQLLGLIVFDFLILVNYNCTFLF